MKPRFSGSFIWTPVNVADGDGYQFRISSVTENRLFAFSKRFHLHLTAPSFSNIVIDKNAMFKHWVH